MLMVTATLLLSGCFRHQSKVVVNEDGSGSITETLLVDRGALEAGDAAAARMPRARDLALPSWVTVADYAAGSQEGLILSVAFEDPAQCNERVNALHRLLAHETGSMATTAVELTRQQDGWRFTVRTDNVAATPDLGLGGTNALTDAVYHGGQLTLVVQLPGRVVDHNADQEINGELVWVLSAQAVQSRFYARTHTGSVRARSPRDDRTLQLATAAATIGGLAVFAAVAMSRKRNPLTAVGRGTTDPAHPSAGARSAHDTPTPYLASSAPTSATSPPRHLAHLAHLADLADGGIDRRVRRAGGLGRTGRRGTAATVELANHPAGDTTLGGHPTARRASPTSIRPAPPAPRPPRASAEGGVV